MGKRKPKNNFVKSSPKAVTDDDTSDGEGKLFRELRQGRSGAAFIHPQRCQGWAAETPTQQNPTVPSSADTTAVVTESFDADDEEEVDRYQVLQVSEFLKAPSPFQLTIMSMAII